MKNLNIIILAGGFGKRIQSISKGIPKPLMKIGSGVFLDLVLEKIFNNYNNSNIFLSLHYRPKLFKDYINNSRFKKRINAIIEPIPLGTGGAIKNVIDSVEIASPFITLNGDTLSKINLESMMNEMKKNEHKAMIGVSSVKNIYRYGSVIFDKGKVEKFKEKNTYGDGWINNGHYVFNKDIFNNTKKSFSLEKELLPYLVAKNELGVFKVKDDDFIDIGIPSDYKKLQNLYK